MIGKESICQKIFFILTILYTYNLHTSSYNGSLIVLCCLTCRVTFMSRRLVFITCRLMFMSCRIVFITRRLTFMSRRLIFVTHRIQKCSYIKFRKNFGELFHNFGELFHNFGELFSHVRDKIEDAALQFGSVRT